MLRLLSPRLRGDRSKRSEVEGGARTPAAFLPHNRRRFVSIPVQTVGRGLRASDLKPQNLDLACPPSSGKGGQACVLS